MDAVEYVKTLHRLCKSQDGCFKCILDSEDGCIAAASRYEGYENTVQIVEQWAKDHPVKTRKSEFLKLFPDAPIVDGTILVCPKIITNGFKPNCDKIDCYKCREKYWKEETDL